MLQDMLEESPRINPQNYQGKSIIHIQTSKIYRHTLMAEKSLATPDCVQSLPTKGMN